MASATSARAASGCLVRRVALGSGDVKALLTAPVLGRSHHFVLQGRAARPIERQLPTGVAPIRTSSVDKQQCSAWFGLAMVVPKRIARRAVTRNLIKRQIRDTVRRRYTDWLAMHLLVRQRGAFDARQYTSAASSALRMAVRVELEQLFDNASAMR